MIGRKKLGLMTAGSVIVAGATIGATVLATGAAHADEPGTFSLTSVNTYQTSVAGLPPATGWEAVFSVTCTAGDGFFVKTVVSQITPWTGTSATYICTGSPQTINDPITTSGSDTLAPGSASAGAVLYVGTNVLPTGGPGGRPAVLNAVPVDGFGQQTVSTG